MLLPKLKHTLTNKRQENRQVFFFFLGVFAGLKRLKERKKMSIKIQKYVLRPSWMFDGETGCCSGCFGVMSLGEYCKTQTTCSTGSVQRENLD